MRSRWAAASSICASHNAPAEKSERASGPSSRSAFMPVATIAAGRKRRKRASAAPTRPRSVRSRMKAYMLGTTAQIDRSRQIWNSRSAASVRRSSTAITEVAPTARAISQATWISSGWL